MKPVELHPGSLLAGIGLCLLAFVAMGQQMVHEKPQPVGGTAEEMVRAKDWVQVYEGAPYSVPSGKRLVLTAAGGDWKFGGPGTGYGVRIDGSMVFQARHGGSSSLFTLPRGIVAGPGSLVEPFDDGPGGAHLAIVWGFLEPASGGREYVQLDSDSPFTVPTGKIFVLTGAMSRDTYNETVELMRNGVRVLTLAGLNAYLAPRRFTASAGETLSVRGGPILTPDFSLAWGYLANE